MTRRNCIVTALPFLAAAFMPAADVRSVTGTVTDARGNALRGAAVEIENTRTLAVASFLTRDDGRFYFHDLDPDIDYTLKAKYKKWWSKERTLSKFSGRKETILDLTIPIE